jgi:hypothetical protein
MFLSVDVGHSHILQRHLPRGPPSTFLSIDGGRSQILQHRLPGGPRRCPALSGSHSQICGNASQGAITVHTTITRRTFFHRFFWVLALLRTQRQQLRQTSFNKSNNRFIYKRQKSRRLQVEAGALRVFWLVFKLLDYKLCSVFDAGMGSLLHLHDGPLHHRLKGDLGVPSLEACQHILCHCLHQGVAISL